MSHQTVNEAHAQALLAETRVTIQESDQETLRKARCVAATELVLHACLLPLLAGCVAGFALNLIFPGPVLHPYANDCTNLGSMTPYCSYSNSPNCSIPGVTSSIFRQWNLMAILVIHALEMLGILSGLFGFVGGILAGLSFCQAIYSSKYVQLSIFLLVRRRPRILVCRLIISIFAFVTVVVLRGPSKMPNVCTCQPGPSNDATCGLAPHLVLTPEFKRAEQEGQDWVDRLKVVYTFYGVLGIAFLVATRVHLSLVKNVNVEVETRMYELRVVDRIPVPPRGPDDAAEGDVPTRGQ